MAARKIKYWVLLGIASPGGGGPTRAGPMGLMRTRQSAVLLHCERDLDFWLGAPSGEFCGPPPACDSTVEPDHVRCPGCAH